MPERILIRPASTQGPEKNDLPKARRNCTRVKAVSPRRWNNTLAVTPSTIQGQIDYRQDGRM